MSDFDDELEDDFNEGPAVDDINDDFADPQQSTAALTKEINKLRQKNEGLRQYNVRQKDRYKDEVRSFLSPLIQKYKDIQNENEFLKRQIKEISQNTASLSLAKHNGENGGNGEHHEDNPLRLMENTIEEKEREISVLNKMVKSLEEESNSIKRDMAELPELKENVKSKNNKISHLEDEKFDLSSKIEAKDSMLSKYLNQVNELETNVYVLNKRLSERVGQIENGKVSEYEEQLQKANKQINQLNEKIDHLEKQLSDYQDTMNSLEEELDEDNFMKAATASTASLSSIDLDKDEVLLEDDEEIEMIDKEVSDDEILKTPSYDYSQLYDDKKSHDDLPSDDELLAHDIDLEEIEEMPESSYDDSEISIDDLPVDEDILSEFDHIDDSEISIDELDDLDLDLDEDELDLNPLSQFESSDNVMDEDRDHSKLLKKEAK